MAVDEFHVPPSEAWNLTPSEVWMLVEYRTNKGKPKIKPMTRDRMEELERQIAEKEASRERH